MEVRQVTVDESLNDGASMLDALHREVETFMSRITEIVSSAARPQRLPYRRRGIGRTPASQFVRQMLKERRERDTVFGADLFGEPAWDMFLDLFVAAEERRKVSVSSLCIAASVPPTTALRWITNLTDRGLIVRRADPSDGRRVFLELAPHVHQELSQLVASWMESQSWLRSE